MSSIRKIFITALLTASSLIINSAHATQFALDEFSVTKDGRTNYFRDTFSNGDPRNTGSFFGSNLAQYSYINTLAATETNGKLLIDPTTEPVITGSVSGQLTHFQRGRLLTNISNSPTDVGRGLKDGDSIVVTGLFDLIEPTIIRERYGVRLTDFGPTRGGPRDIIAATVNRYTDGVVVDFTQTNSFSLFTTLDRVLLTAGNLGLTQADFEQFDQIELTLQRNLPSAGDTNPGVTSGFRLIDIDSILNPFSYAFTGAGTIFEGERFTRAEFYVQAPLATVPLPQTALLFLFGLTILIQRRRKVA